MSSNSLPIPLNTWRQVSLVYSTSEDTKEQGEDGVALQQVDGLNDTSLKSAMNVHQQGLSTCSLGVVEKYLEAVKKCSDCDRNGGTDLQGTQVGDIRVRQPSKPNSAPNAELMRCTLLDLLDIHKDNRATMSLDECRDIISFLHGYVFPIVPQVTHSKKVHMTVHVYEKGIVSRVERCPYYNPRGVPYVDAAGNARQWGMTGDNENHIDGGTMGRTGPHAKETMDDIGMPENAAEEKSRVENFKSDRFQPY